MRVGIVGGGSIGKAVTYDLLRSDIVESVIVMDPDKKCLENFENNSGKVLDYTEVATESMMRDCVMIISCAPYYHNPHLARRAVSLGCHFLDFGGNNHVVQDELLLHSDAQQKGVLVVPDLGLAPGLVSVITKSFVEQMEEVDTVELMVGGLPQNPEPPLGYALTFSLEGLINEYVEPAVVLKNGHIETVAPLDNWHEIETTFIPERLECFSTSGGVSTLCGTYQGTIKNLSYSTIRYIGHWIRISDLHRMEQFYGTGRGVLMLEALRSCLKPTSKDLVIVKATARGIMVQGTEKVRNPRTLTYEIFDTGGYAPQFTAMQRMTAFPAISVARAILDGSVKVRGAMTQEHFVDTSRVFNDLEERGIRIGFLEE